MSVQFMRSANLFCWGEYGALVWCTIPELAHTALKRLFAYSVLLFVRTQLIFNPYFVLSIDLNSRKQSNTSPFDAI